MLSSIFLTFLCRGLNCTQKRSHIKTEKTQVLCTSCEKPFPSDKSLAVHIAANHVSTKCRVDWCRKEKESRKLERIHFKNGHSRDQGKARLHEKIPPPPCDICGKTTHSQAGMRYHRKKHLHLNVVVHNGAEETLKSVTVKQELPRKDEVRAMHLSAQE